MGTHRRDAEAIVQHFRVDEDSAYVLAMVMDRARIGDDIANALHEITDRGDLIKCVRDLRLLRDSLNTAITSISNHFEKLEKRDVTHR